MSWDSDWNAVQGLELVYVDGIGVGGAAGPAETASNLDGTMTCDVGIGTAERPVNVASYTLTLTGTTAPDAVASWLATTGPVDFVTLRYDTDSSPAGSGYIDCGTLAPRPTLEAFTLEMSGQGDLVIRDLFTGAYLPGPLPIEYPGDGTGPNLMGLLMRPSSLGWPGQNPADERSQAFWAPDEVAALTETYEFANITGYSATSQISVSAYRIPSDLICVL